MSTCPLATLATVPKVWRDGTHRSVAPSETIRRVEQVRAAMGITRLADVTGLDAIGIPVVQAVRPNSRSISVAQGKGVSAEAARVSAMMEAIEGFHSERVSVPLVIGSWAELRVGHRIIDVAGLPRPSRSRFHADARILWVGATDLFDGLPTLVPFESVHTDYRLPLPTGSGCFAMTSNGVASGNHLLEALSHALCEVIERDGISMWIARSEHDDVRLDPDTVDSPTCRELLDAYDRAGFDVAIWDGTSDIGVPVLIVAITDRSDGDLVPTFGAHGYGCHPNRDIALSRALTEAAQSRLTHIAGSRDDKTPAEYAYGLTPPVRSSIASQISGTPRRPFQSVATVDFDTLNEDVDWLLDRLRAVGFGEVVYVDLTRPEIGIPVVRVVAPGLELAGITDAVRFGARAARARRAVA